jgi:hypothetical protein
LWESRLALAGSRRGRGDRPDSARSCRSSRRLKRPLSDRSRKSQASPTPDPFRSGRSVSRRGTGFGIPSQLSLELRTKPPSSMSSSVRRPAIAETLVALGWATRVGVDYHNAAAAATAGVHATALVRRPAIAETLVAFEGGVVPGLRTTGLTGLPCKFQSEPSTLRWGASTSLYKRATTKRRLWLRIRRCRLDLPILLTIRIRGNLATP